MAYSYSTLDTASRRIRLIKLQPGDWDDDIRCDVFQASLDTQPQYTALSYAWGNQNISKPLLIYCNGISFAVSENLYVALRRLRCPDDPLVLWIDAICINQIDELERTHQVSMMRSIYMKSIETLIWLGDQKAHDDMGNLKRIDLFEPMVWYGNARDSKRLSRYDTGSHIDKLYLARKHDVYGAFCLISLLSQGVPIQDIAFLECDQTRDRVFAAMAMFMQLPWFYRIWVVQETVVARRATVCYGTAFAPWEMFSQAAVRYEENRRSHCLDLNQQLFRSALDTITLFSQIVLDIEQTKVRWKAEKSINLLQLLRKFRSKQATDHRDKVYALLGLITDWGSAEPIVPDYTLSVETVYKKTVLKLIEVTQSTSVLCGNLRKRPRHALPSWVPDWSAPFIPYESDRLNRFVLYNAASSEPSALRLHGTDLMETKAAMVDSIAVTGDFLAQIGIHDAIKVLGQWADLAGIKKTPDEPYVGGGTRLNAFWRTLCADTLYLESPVPGTDDVSLDQSYRRSTDEDSDSYTNWQLWLKCFARDTGFYGLIRKFELPKRKMEEGISAVHYAIVSATALRRFFITQKGYMGLGPEGLLPGDSIHVIAGERVPFVLRKRTEHSACRFEKCQPLVGRGFKRVGFWERCGQSHKSHLLVGDCFVMGIMDGEFAGGKYGDVYLR